jgi:hypothetical protein
LHNAKNKTAILGKQLSRPEVDQINTHWLASKYLKQKSSERSNKNEVLMKTEILVSVSADKPKAITSVKAERKTGKLLKR